MSKYGIIIVILFGRLERAPTFLVPIINSPLLTTAGDLFAQNLCTMPELQLDQFIKKEIVRFSTDLFTEFVKNLSNLVSMIE